ncbi:hypothetical protein EPYR_01930 [Erwinia pyrifoliae DSM 12163]|nr:hypothetical protein EJP617_29360 [Erwinia sp. Ejp617]CAY74310.1 hypothetical protein EPYR_01930 [Erwinia pyrifoliae DSM 12163]
MLEARYPPHQFPTLHISFFSMPYIKIIISFPIENDYPPIN